MSELWTPDDHVGYYAEVWSGETFEHYAIFPVPEESASVVEVLAALPDAGLRVIVISKRGALGVSTVVEGWKDPSPASVVD